MDLIRPAADSPLSSGASTPSINRNNRRFGPLVGTDGTKFRLWAPSHAQAELLIHGQQPLQMVPAADGFLEASVGGVGEGTLYQFRIGKLTFPDLASRQQRSNTSGWSVVRAPLAMTTPSRPLRPWHEAVLCEVHVGTVTPEGTFNALRERLEHFRDAGFTCLEIMPVNAFPGARNWGYDGTLIFAPAVSYGTPQDLRSLVDRAHELGLSIVLDVVYNHFGETDNFVSNYAPEWFSGEEETPWGPGVDFHQAMVRKFYYENAQMWVSEYDFDGLRFDSVHEVKTAGRDKFLGELAEGIRQVKPDARLIIENVRNSFRWLERNDRNEPLTYLAQWNDDMHHVLTYQVTGEGKRTGYDDKTKDPIADLEKALANGFVHDPTEGDGSDGRTRGGEAERLPPDSFITYVENHDQIGNRADATRLSKRVSPAQLDFVHFVKFLAPQIPLCFMGDEANISSPFPFFFDLPADTAQAKATDRYKQMRDMFGEEVEDGELPDPNDPGTFAMAKLDWHQYQEPKHVAALERFRVLGSWRRELVWPLSATPCLDARSVRFGDGLIVTWVFEAGHLSMALNACASSIALKCNVAGNNKTVGDVRLDGDQLALGPWSAVVW